MGRLIGQTGNVERFPRQGEPRPGHQKVWRKQRKPEQPRQEGADANCNGSDATASLEHGAPAPPSSSFVCQICLSAMKLRSENSRFPRAYRARLGTFCPISLPPFDMCDCKTRHAPTWLREGERCSRRIRALRTAWPVSPPAWIPRFYEGSTLNADTCSLRRRQIARIYNHLTGPYSFLHPSSKRTTSL